MIFITIVLSRLLYVKPKVNASPSLRRCNGFSAIYLRANGRHSRNHVLCGRGDTVQKRRQTTNKGFLEVRHGPSVCSCRLPLSRLTITKTILFCHFERARCLNLNNVHISRCTFEYSFNKCPAIQLHCKVQFCSTTAHIRV